MSSPRQSNGAPAVVVKSITVQCPQALAFRVWTTDVDLWWPKAHVLSGDPNTEVRLEEHVGGRFYERTSSGEEKTWGEILTWEPPHRLAFTWYLGTDAQQPTVVDVRFHAENARRTRVDLEHRGPDLIGELWNSRVERFIAGWDAVFESYTKFFE
ncbi:MAG: SRPBCC domain-containing protein [Caldilineaceae bacterium]